MSPYSPFSDRVDPMCRRAFPPTTPPPVLLLSPRSHNPPVFAHKALSAVDSDPMHVRAVYPPSFIKVVYAPPNTSIPSLLSLSQLPLSSPVFARPFFSCPLNCRETPLPSSSLKTPSPNPHRMALYLFSPPPHTTPPLVPPPPTHFLFVLFINAYFHSPFSVDPPCATRPP